MTDEAASALEAGHQSVTGASETAAVGPSGQEPEKPAPETNSTAASKTVAIAIARLSHARSEEETAEENRRWTAIKSNRHPDTGERLRPGDEKALRPLEKIGAQKCTARRKFRCTQ